MIMIWDQKEVFMGTDLQGFNEACNILSANGIKYEYKVVDRNSPSLFGTSRRATTGTFGEDVDSSKTYYIYVHKKDYDNAYGLIRK